MGTNAATVERDEQKPRPFAKSIGGKTRLLPELLRRLPEGRLRYHEPFVGGGALFFALVATGRIDRAWLGDTNGDLIAAYLAVRNDVEGLIKRLRRMPNDEGFYYRTRAKVPKDDLSRGARFVYLNKTSFNGLWRVNKKGEMNAPWGHYERPTICDAGVLRAASKALGKAEVQEETFATVLTRAKPGDVVYFDPIYWPVREAAATSFTAYTSVGFTWEDHVRLLEVTLELGKRGVHVLLSNSSAPAIETLYREHSAEAFHALHVDRVHAPRSVNSKGGERGEVPEVLAYAGPGIGDWPWGDGAIPPL